MKIKIEEKHENPLLNRQDITFLVDHSGTATPPRIDVRAKLAAMLNCQEDQLYITKLIGLYGQSISQGKAHLFPSKEVALSQEQSYIIKRHSSEDVTPPPSAELPETKPEKKEAEKETPTEKVEKPVKEEPPKQKKEEAPKKAKPAKEEAKETPKKEKHKQKPKEEKAKTSPEKKKES
ncbi:MAG: 30S ribosomal protein S24e [Promethearchaeota archaeon]